MLLPVNRDFKGGPFTKNPLAQHTPPCMDTPWSFWGSMLFHSLQGQNVTTAMLRTHTEEPQVALEAQGCSPRGAQDPQEGPKILCQPQVDSAQREPCGIPALV